ncbi:MAG TPA: choice-of-anchor X domain-containing protein, partial [Nitrospira sp.]|nr:choice-of-anchor X domain-containing protein [Nitrospira sp.]
DLDHDGLHEMLMHDDGAEGDQIAGDGIYSAVWEQDGVLLAWTVSPNRPGSLSDSGFVTVEARATYMTGSGPREVRVATIRANPVFAGSH